MKTPFVPPYFLTSRRRYCSRTKEREECFCEQKVFEVEKWHCSGSVLVEEVLVI